MMVKMLNSMKKDIVTLKKEQSEIKNDITQIKNTLEGIHNRLGEAEDQISELEDRIENITQSENQKEEKQLKQKQKQEDKNKKRELRDNMKHNNIRIASVPEEAEREKVIKNLFEEIMAENFPNLVKENVTQVQEAQRTPYKKNLNRPMPRHIIIKMPKIKERILKAAREEKPFTNKPDT
uniref:L1 transposable element RRM domain-containing protein n=1 Tax=Myotis myotis TaxID=51298 RepID=A0A7J8AM38_MYOMY|nr:hypothetical protein mMyoMyo1_007850 [Myotis myotis]